MSKQIQINGSLLSFIPKQTDKFEQLVNLALDMRWSWSHYADKIWHRINQVLWDLTQNPWAILMACSREKLEEILDDAAFSKELDKIIREKRESENKPAWFQQNYKKSPLTCVAYFSMEFMLSEALPIYSGGLGNVAGDQLKAASDLGVPVIGVGLLYQQGYFRQLIDKDGTQQALFPYNDPSQLPITPLRKSNGEWLRLEIKLPGYSVWLRAWQVQVGRVKLYLLDTNDIANFPAHRPITSELYGGGSELRLKQELVLGIGGWRLLQELGITPQVCHINEGHAAFVVLERARSLMKENNVPFDIAMATSRAGNLFTTHTPVPAGFDYFEPELIKTYLTVYANELLGISIDELLALGRKNPQDHLERFNMAYLAIHGCGAINAVSKLHGKVSRKLFQPLFDRWPQDEVPIGHVTNGVHVPSWDSSHADQLWTEACGKDRWLGTIQTQDENIRRISDAKLWHFRSLNRTGLINYVRQRLSLNMAASGNPPEAVDYAKNILDPNILTLCFARRFASYKRPNLLLHNPERLKKILTNQDRPVQLIIAGKAHPADQWGGSMIQQWARFVRQPEIRAHAVFLSDYDMQLAERLVQGADLWINNPVMPHEASGTSGMKVLVNGGLNLSVLDGWWAEAYNPNLGWALGDGKVYTDDRQRDASEAQMLYDLLEHEIIPEFYDRDNEGLPVKWLKRVKESMSDLTPRFSATRTVMEYTEQHYLPAAAAYIKRAAKKCAAGKQIIGWRKSLKERWSNIRFVDFTYRKDADQYVFEAQVDLNGLDPESVRVELYADHVNGSERICKPMRWDKEHKNAAETCLYTLTLPSKRPPTDFTPRIVPFHSNACVPLEDSYILWQK